MPGFNFHAWNMGEVMEQYERYRRDPASVDEQTRAIFERWQPPEAGEREETVPLALANAGSLKKVRAAVQLAQAIRSFGYLKVRLDPLGFFPPRGEAALELETHGLSQEDLQRLPAEVVGEPAARQAENALEAINILQEVYETTCGFDYDHINNPEERGWLQAAAEKRQFRPDMSAEDKRSLLERLTQVEAFEQFLQRFFPGKTRFSIEGLDILVPMLDRLLSESVEAGICTSLIGMPHRGRLNVLAHILAVSYERIFTEFKDPAGNSGLMGELGWTGDVKYHLGASFAATEQQEVRMIIFMPPIPSHLELINPVVEGMTRSLQSQTDHAGAPVLYPDACLPVLIHGDAAFPGEGIVAESLNLSRLAGYQVGGTIHIIGNNQLGFTTYPSEGRSTLFASDLAKGFEIPIIHVNADDPLACLEAARTAFAYRQQFHKDFLIDLVGYRRYGHNEGDEPAFTQPQMYKRIQAHPSLRKSWADELVRQGSLENGLAEQLLQQGLASLQHAMDDLPAESQPFEPDRRASPGQEGLRARKVTLPRLKELGQELLRVPEDFHLDPKLKRAMERRKQAFATPAEARVDWSLAEELALASILAEGTPVRLTGQDVERGTFSQRHAAFHDTETEQRFIPLQSIPQAKASFEVINSPLSEAAALGFEYGYSVRNPQTLIIWEAQYGDFINNAQTILDEFVLSGQAKWDQRPALVLNLPHGNEGQGPNHSSSRAERFLQMGSEVSLRLANCTTAAQYFHLLRDQAAHLAEPFIPLVILTPKSLLRHPRTASTLKDLAEGAWQKVLDDEMARQRPEKVRRAVLCSGKMAIDLLETEDKTRLEGTAIIRLEQLLPFPADELNQILVGYKNLNEIVWAQEEPQNLGAWSYLQPRLADLFGGKRPARLVSRPPSPSSSEGSFTRYTLNQKELVAEALRTNEPKLAPGPKRSKEK